MAWTCFLKLLHPFLQNSFTHFWSTLSRSFSLYESISVVYTLHLLHFATASPVALRQELNPDAPDLQAGGFFFYWCPWPRVKVRTTNNSLTTTNSEELALFSWKTVTTCYKIHKSCYLLQFVVLIVIKLLTKILFSVDCHLNQLDEWRLVWVPEVFHLFASTLRGHGTWTLTFWKVSKRINKCFSFKNLFSSNRDRWRSRLTRVCLLEEPDHIPLPRDPPLQSVDGHYLVSQVFQKSWRTVHAFFLNQRS